MGSGLLFCRFSFLPDDVHQVIITHVVNDLLKFFVRSGAFCGRIGAAADAGNGHSGQFGDPPPKPVCARCGFVSTLIWVTTQHSRSTIHDSRPSVAEMQSCCISAIYVRLKV